jgi:hypothetical protein
MCLKCDARKLALTKESVAVVPGTSHGLYHSGGAFNVIVFKQTERAGEPKEKRRKDAMKLPCPVPNCTSRHHSDLQLFCSAALNGNSAYGIPVLFYEQYTLILPLQRVATDLEGFHTSIFEATCAMQVVKIENRLIRGVCMMRPNHTKREEKKCFVFPGRGTFGFDLTG